jgi:hypothetical protein
VEKIANEVFDTILISVVKGVDEKESYCDDRYEGLLLAWFWALLFSISRCLFY